MVLQAYSAVTDLLVGDITLGSTVNAEKYVQDAADEMDSKLGFIYETPIDLNAASLQEMKNLLSRMIEPLSPFSELMQVLSCNLKVPNKESPLLQPLRNLVANGSASTSRTSPSA